MNIPQKNKIKLLENLKGTKEKDIDSFLLCSNDISVNDYIVIKENVEIIEKSNIDKSSINEGIIDTLTGIANLGSMLTGLGTWAFGLYQQKLASGRAQCANMPSEDKARCFEAKKREAMQEQIRALEQGKSACRDRENPQECVTKIDMKIQKLKSKI